jgi:hypothetical protein
MSQNIDEAARHAPDSTVALQEVKDLITVQRRGTRPGPAAH